MSDIGKMKRRDFLKVLTVTSAAATTGCAKELPEKLIPYVIQPDEVIPGVASWYASTCNECETNCGTLVRTREGRALKVEGNPYHPVNRGGLCARGQSSIQSHYDPDRIREPLKRAANGSFKPISWTDAVLEISKALTDGAGKKSAIITESQTGSINNLISHMQSNFAGLEHLTYSLLGKSEFDASIEKAFGRNLKANYNFAKADVIVSFGADFLGTYLSPVEFAKGFSSQRVKNASKFYALESRLSQTGGNADKWIMRSAGSTQALMSALVKLISGDNNIDSLLENTGVEKTQLEKIAKDLKKAKAPLIIGQGAGSDEQSLYLSHLLNSKLGATGNTLVFYRDNSNTKTKDLKAELPTLVKQAKDYSVIITSNVNPSYSLPSSAGFESALASAGLVVSLSNNLDDTSRLANLVLPLSSSFESWDDSEPRPGVFGINQPSMQPLYESITLGDLLLSVLKTAKKEQPAESYADYIKKQWIRRVGSEAKWLEAVEQGGSWKNASTGTSANLKAVAIKAAKPSKELSLVAFTSVHLGDGRAANRPWAQEIPDPITTAVWGSWVEMHPDVATQFSVEHGDVVKVVSAGLHVEAPAYVTKYVHPNVLAVPIGRGQESLGRYANGIGTNPLKLTKVEKGTHQFVTSGVKLRKSIAKEDLVVTQGHDSQLNRGLVRKTSGSDSHAEDNHSATGHGSHDSHAKPMHKEDAHGSHEKHGSHDEHGAQDSHAAHDGHKDGHGDGHQNPHGLKMAHHDTKALGPQHEPQQMYKQMDHVQYKWGMTVDLAACTGCSACVTACYAENNVAVVGKEYARQGREMSWLKISRFLDDDTDQPITGYMPMMCQHCNNAPCEPVCPVYATYHSDEGLNTMVYNRCVGTRYCSNNCSYKVRRFNWFDYEWPEPLNWQLNPDVTTRTVGVMEKCTFCVQRIREVQNNAKTQGREVQDGEVQPACASSCPTEAIKFGNLLDSNSEVAKLSKDKRSYKILNVELNTQPAVTYLAKHGD